MSYLDYVHSRGLPEHIVVSGPESSGLGLSVGRLSVGTLTEPDAAAILDLAKRSNLDLVIIRYDAACVGLGRQLLGPAHVVWQADTLLYFSKGLSHLANEDLDGSQWLEEAGPEGASIVADAVRAIFRDYPNHYASNPHLDQGRVLEGYVEWAQRHLDSNAARVLLLRELDSELPIALCATTFNSRRAEISLAGVAPGARGRGVYRSLLARVELWLAEEGIEEVDVSTQAGNRAPLRTWISRSYQFQLALNTLHLMRRDPPVQAPAS